MLSIFAEPISPGPIYRESISQETGVAERESETHRPLLFEDAADVESSEAAPAAETSEEFEIVLGRRQIASVLFVATVILALFSAVSYLAGKSISPKKATQVDPAATVAVSVPAAEVSTPAPSAPAAPTAPMINASIAPPARPPAVRPAIVAAKSPALNTSIPKASTISVTSKTVATTRAAPAVFPEVSTEAPMFAEPVRGAMYLQMGAVDRGAAAIFAEGLRKRGFSSFVATGPNAASFRVLIGPLRDAAAYARTKDALDRIGVNTFGRTYEK